MAIGPCGVTCFRRKGLCSVCERLCLLLLFSPKCRLTQPAKKMKACRGGYCGLGAACAIKMCCACRLPERQSKCELEVDACVEDILNRQEVTVCRCLVSRNSFGAPVAYPSLKAANTEDTPVDTVALGGLCNSPHLFPQQRCHMQLTSGHSLKSITVAAKHQMLVSMIAAHAHGIAGSWARDQDG